MYCSNKILYTVKAGDTLYTIAKHYNTTVEAIIEANAKINPNNLKIGETINVCPGYSSIFRRNSYKNISKAKLELSNAMRNVWEQHVMWTRMAIISTVLNLADADLVAERLLKNAPDMGRIFAPYYGDNVAAEISRLIKEHLVIASQLVVAAKNGDNDAAKIAEQKWYENADEIAEYLSSINPYYDKEAFKKMLHEHLALTKQEAVDIISADYKKSIETYDKIEKQALMMADALTNGIVLQFPEKFVA